MEVPLILALGLIAEDDINKHIMLGETCTKGNNQLLELDLWDER